MGSDSRRSYGDRMKDLTDKLLSGCGFRCGACMLLADQDLRLYSVIRTEIKRGAVLECFESVTTTPYKLLNTGAILLSKDETDQQMARLARSVTELGVGLRTRFPQYIQGFTPKAASDEEFL